MNSGIPRSQMGLLADKISEQIAVWETHCDQSGSSLPSVGFDTTTPVLTAHTPDNALEAREKIMDSAFKLLHLAAGPSKFASMAISYSQAMMALKWLFHFKIFDLVPEEPIEYDKLAASANVPVLELKRMLRLVMTSYIFTEHEEEMVQHNTTSRAFAHDENMRRGIPFFCDVIMPAAAKMVDATTRWPGSEDSDETACNIAQSSDLTFPEYLTQSNQTEGYTCLMNLLAGQTFQQNVYLANVVQGFDWASLPRDSLVVDELAELFPHLQFEVRGPQDKLSIMEDFVKMRNPGLLSQIDFCPHDLRDAEIIRSARVYLLAGTLGNLPDDDVRDILGNIAAVMAPTSTILIVDSVLPEIDDGSLAAQRESRCRDMTIRQLHNAGARTFHEWADLIYTVDDKRIDFEYIVDVPGSIFKTMVVEPF